MTLRILCLITRLILGRRAPGPLILKTYPIVYRFGAFTTGANVVDTYAMSPRRTFVCRLFPKLKVIRLKKSYLLYNKNHSLVFAKHSGFSRTDTTSKSNSILNTRDVSLSNKYM